MMNIHTRARAHGVGCLRDSTAIIGIETDEFELRICQSTKPIIPVL